MVIGAAYGVIGGAARLRSAGRWAITIGFLAAIALLGYRLPAIIGELQARNLNDQTQVSNVRALVAPTDPSAVFLSYQLNDLIAYYGERSVLNYRRIPVSDPIHRRYQVEMLEPVLTTLVDRLLATGTPVYVIETADTDFDDAFDLLQRRYVLTSESPYRVIGAR